MKKKNINTKEKGGVDSEVDLVDKKEYLEFISELKKHYKSSQLRAAIKFNTSVIMYYWEVGRRILEKQKVSKWGDKILKKISNDMQKALPGSKGFSTRNLRHMRNFAQLYTNIEVVKQPVSLLPWGHIIVLMQKIREKLIREWYVAQIIDNGWSRDTLKRHIQEDLYERQGIEQNKTSNFIERLPGVQSRLAQDILKNPYNFSFLDLHDDALEREIERASVKHIKKFLVELGKGFAFVGDQFPISVGGQDFFLDMLFYNYKLHSFVVVEIKATSFKPEHTGQLNFYLSAVDGLIKSDLDNPSIGLLLCKSHDQIVAEYSL